MKKIAVVSALLLISANCLYSQISIGKGIKGGLNIATLGGNDAKGPSGEPFETVTRFNAGAFISISIVALPLTLQPEVLYTIKGSKVSGNFFGTPFTVTASLTYVEIPVLLKFNIPLVPGAPVKPNIFAGPAVGVLLSSKAKTEVPGQPTQEDDEKSTTEGTDFGVIVGAGLDINLVVLSLTVDARYNIGMKTVDKSSPPGDVKNRVISVNVGVSL